jgi:3-oxoadipate enol-lactonase
MLPTRAQGAPLSCWMRYGLSSSRANNRRMGLSDFSPVASAGHRLISYDARGHGKTSGTSAPEDYTWKALAQDLLALVGHFSPDRPASAIGSSMATGTLLHAVTQHPDRFDRLVLTAPPTAWETRAGQGDTYRMMADMVEKSDPEALAAFFARTPVPPILQGVPNFPAPPFDLIPTVFRGAAMTDLPALETLGTLTHPTLILAWEGDPGHPESTAQKLADTLQTTELHISTTHEDLLTSGGKGRSIPWP